MKPLKRVYAITLGCPKNRVDTEVLLADLLSHGFVLAERAEDADLAIVNTCAFIEDARRESVETLAALARRLGPDGILVAAGCMVEGFRDEIKAAVPEVSVTIGTRELMSLREVIGGGQPRQTTSDGPRLLTTPAHYAYLKVAEGCSRRCAFCIIPSLRGRQRSREPDAVVEEARALTSLGVKEIVLVAQDLTHWGKDLYGRPALASLVRRLATDVDGLHWLRLMYLYPRDVTEELLDTIAANPRILPYLDLPVQHGDDRVLAAMRRGTTRAGLLRLVEEIRRRLPGAVLRTTYMVGFPGETDTAFENLIAFARAARFDMAGVFKFSCEKRTLASRMKGYVGPKLVRKRMKRLQGVLSEVAAELRSGMIGQVHEAVVESVCGRTATGRLWMQAPEVDGQVRIAVRGAKPEPGDFVFVRIIGARGSDFLAECI